MQCSRRAKPAALLLHLLVAACRSAGPLIARATAQQLPWWLCIGASLLLTTARSNDMLLTN